MVDELHLMFTLCGALLGASHCITGLSCPICGTTQRKGCLQLSALFRRSSRTSCSLSDRPSSSKRCVCPRLQVTRSCCSRTNNDPPPPDVYPWNNNSILNADLWNAVSSKLIVSVPLRTPNSCTSNESFVSNNLYVPDAMNAEASSVTSL